MLFLNVAFQTRCRSSVIDGCRLSGSQHTVSISKDYFLKIVLEVSAVGRYIGKH
jgi:hypothetical protein